MSQGQADLLKYAKNETVENLKQIHYAAVSCGLNKPGTENADIQKPRRILEGIPEKANDETGEWGSSLEIIMEFITPGPTAVRWDICFALTNENNIGDFKAQLE